MILVSKTEDARQLAAIYTAANVLFNPTREDNYPTVNLEAQACETPVVTYNTGGCRETIQIPTSKVCQRYETSLACLRCLELACRVAD